MAVHVVSRERRWRIVIHHDHIRARAGSELSNGAPKATAGKLSILLKQHGRRFSPANVGLAVLVFVRQVGHLERLEHVFCVSVGSQAYANAAAKMTGLETRVFQQVYATLKPAQQSRAADAFALMAGFFQSAPGRGGRGPRGGGAQ